MADGTQPATRGPGRRRGAAAALPAFLLLTALAVVHPAFAPPALAQGFSWPWSEPEKKPVPREPVYRPNAVPAPGAAPAPAPGGYGGSYAAGRSNICLQLEQRLVQESQKGSQSRELLPKIETDLRAAQRAAEQADRQLERQDCYEYFLFSKSLRRTRQCVDTAAQGETARRRVAELETQRQEITAASGRSFQDDIIRELARNNCGGTYAQEAKKREGSFWLDEEGGSYSGSGNQFGALPYATYRTVCVRLCDGYYFPISFSTLPNHFQRDADVCQSKCAAPVELYYHQNPGSQMEQAVGAKSQEPYTKLKSAFRYRKEYVAGCSCKQAEYTPMPGTAPAGPQNSSTAPDRRADAAGAPVRPPVNLSTPSAARPR